MAVDQDPLIAQPGQVKAIASAIDERLRQRLSVFAAKTNESVVAGEAPASTKAPSEATTLRSTSDLDAVKMESSLDDSGELRNPARVILRYLSWLNLFLFFSVVAVSLCLCAWLLDDAVIEAARLIDGGGDVQEIHASLKLLEARFS